MYSANNHWSTLGRVSLSALFLSIGMACYPFFLSAQTSLTDDGGSYTISYSGAAEDFLIPSTTTASFISVIMKGGDGGTRNSCNGQAQGGEGAIIRVSFPIGTDPDELQPGGTLRFIVGDKGENQSSDRGGGAGGGGGTAILYQKPNPSGTISASWPGFDIEASADTAWIVLAIAGGGGGAFGEEGGVFSNADACDEDTAKNGTGGNIDTRGTNGGGNNTGGENGRGGRAGSNFRDGGGGGGYLTEGGPASFANRGRRSGIAGGNGGTGSTNNDSDGGFGFGGGGAGLEDGGGGGGGGFSGGGGGNDGNASANNGGGGGSYVNPIALAETLVIDGLNTKGNPAPGEVTYSFPRLTIDGSIVKLPLIEQAQDFVIPADLDLDVINAIAFTARGADGGRVKSDELGANVGRGGEGALVTAEFMIGDGPQELRPGGTLRFIVGHRGNGQTTDRRVGGGGGGGTAVLYRPPGVDDNNDCLIFGPGNVTQPAPSLNIDNQCWSILLVAGGGGGGYITGEGDQNEGRQGEDASLTPDGTDTGDSGDGAPGVNGGSGESPPGNSGQTVRSGGGGGYRPLFPVGGGLPHPAQGTPGVFAGGPGGTGANNFIAGGWGYGGGGAGRWNRSQSGFHGGGGGGGFSGGGGGRSDPGGGGGTFVNNAAIASTIEGAEETSGSFQGCLSYNLFLEPVTGPIARCQSIVTVAIDGTEEFELTPDMVDAGSEDPSFPNGPLDISLCTEFGGELLCGFPRFSFACNSVGRTITDRILRVASPGGEDFCSFIIEVVQGDVGTLTCPDPVTVALEPDDCEAFLRHQINYDNQFEIGFDPEILPNCDSEVAYSVVNPDGSLGVDMEAFESAFAYTFDLGVSTGTYFADYLDEDGEPASQSCSFTVTVNPPTMPAEIECPDNLVVTVEDPGDCMATVEDSGPIDLEFDYNGPGNIITYTITGPGDEPNINTGTGALEMFDFELGTSTVTYAASCDNGLELSNCSFTVTVNSPFNQPPQIVCTDTNLDRLDLSLADGICVQDVIDQVVVSATDDCGIVGYDLLFRDTPFEFSLDEIDCSFVGEQLSIRVFAYDLQGEEAACVSRIEIFDDIGLTCPENIAVETDPGLCTASLSAEMLAPKTTFLCTEVQDYTITYLDDNSQLVTETMGSGNIPAQMLEAGRTYTATYTAENMDGLSSTCSFTIDVEDTEAPVAICSNITANWTDDLAAIASEIGASSTDNCGIVDYSIDLDLSCDNLGVNQTTLTVSDAAGNESACVALVQLNDNTAPTFNFDCDGSISIFGDTNPGECNFTFDELTIINVVAFGTSDECGDYSVTGSIPFDTVIEEPSIEVT